MQITMLTSMSLRSMNSDFEPGGRVCCPFLEYIEKERESTKRPGGRWWTSNTRMPDTEVLSACRGTRLSVPPYASSREMETTELVQEPTITVNDSHRTQRHRHHGT